MGTLTYDSTTRADFEDRLLAHLQIVIGAKLRRGESFYFSWADDSSVGNGRSSIWLHPSIPLFYKFFGSKQPAINPAWVERMTMLANSSAGLRVVPEPDQGTTHEAH